MLNGLLNRRVNNPAARRRVDVHAGNAAVLDRSGANSRHVRCNASAFSDVESCGRSAVLLYVNRVLALFVRVVRFRQCKRLFIRRHNPALELVPLLISKSVELRDIAVQRPHVFAQLNPIVSAVQIFAEHLRPLLLQRSFLRRHVLAKVELVVRYRVLNLELHICSPSLLTKPTCF